MCNMLVVIICHVLPQDTEPSGFFLRRESSDGTMPGERGFVNVFASFPPLKFVKSASSAR